MRCLQQAVSILRYHSLFGEDVQGILQMAYPAFANGCKVWYT